MTNKLSTRVEYGKILLEMGAKHKDTFGTFGKPEVLLKHFGLMPQDIIKAAHQARQRKSS